jgi:hypothetical protein
MLDVTNNITHNTTTSDAGGGESAASLSRPGSAASTSSMPTLEGGMKVFYFQIWIFFRYVVIIFATLLSFVDVDG